MNFNRGNRAFLLVINQSVHSVGPKAYYLQHFSTALTLIQRIPLYAIFFVNLRARFDMNGTPLGWNRPKIIRYSGVWGPNEVIWGGIFITLWFRALFEPLISRNSGFSSMNSFFQRKKISIMYLLVCFATANRYLISLRKSFITSTYQKKNAFECRKKRRYWTQKLISPKFVWIKI